MTSTVRARVEGLDRADPSPVAGATTGAVPTG
jgi:hypothetical protein